MGTDKNNSAASIHRRLLNGAKERGEDFQLTLVRYGSERLLYRLAQSSVADRFVLKGALLLLLWEDQLYRPTRDIDLLACMSHQARRRVRANRAQARKTTEARGGGSVEPPSKLTEPAERAGGNRRPSDAACA